MKETANKGNGILANEAAEMTAKVKSSDKKEQQRQKEAAQAVREGAERSKAEKALKSLRLSAKKSAETSYIAGKALLTIKDNKLYKILGSGETYSSFKSYITAQFEISEQYAYMLINAVKVQDILSEAEVASKYIPEKLLRKLTNRLNKDDGKSKIVEIWKEATKGKADKIPSDIELTEAMAATKPQRTPAIVKTDSEILEDPSSDAKAVIDLLRRVSSGKAHLSEDELETLKARLSDICDNAGSEND